ncbi:helix-turn-helix domain-containing protein [Paraburkholderia sp. EG286B]|uniref:helix-turn-helix domain-containing protein n=1 Tax=Paraburkholderia sp. EG286B TaxID=3237011 RepID=UPI0034D321FB
MDEIDDVVKRLRRRAARGGNETESLNYRAAANVLARFQRERCKTASDEQSNAEPTVSTRAPLEQNSTVHVVLLEREPVDSMAGSQEAQDAAVPESPPRVPAITERALTLKEAAELLHVSYWTIYEHRISLGFFKVGGVWRVWPDKLREATASTNSPQPAPAEKENKPCPSTSAKAPMPGTSISARQAANELDKLLAQPTVSRRRSSTTR